MPNTAKRTSFKTTVIAAALAFLPLSAYAAGLGKITVLSGLGQPLRAELEVTANRDEAQSLVARLASVEAFRRAGIEYSPVLGDLRFSRELKERNGRRYVELTTDRPLNEPFIDMLVELNWASGRLVREYTFLLDPPELAAKAASVPSPAATVSPPAARPVETATPAERTDVQSRPVIQPPGPRVAERPATLPSPKPGADAATRTVVSGDTLGKIAAQTMPAGVNLDQMLVALFRNNKEAFDGDNMNRLRAGKILSIPDAAAVSSIAPTEARKVVAAQASDFNRYRQGLAGAAAAAPARDEGAKQEAKGKITPKVEDKAPPATGKDKLEVSRNEVARDAKGKPLQGRISALEEDLIARERALTEANSRIAELEKNLNDLKKLADIKSKAGAELQASAQAAKPAPAAATPAPAEVKKTEPAAPPAAAPADAAKPAEAPKPPAAPPPPKKKPAPPPPPEPEPDFLEENAPLVFGGGAVIALLLGWLGFNVYRKKKAAAANDASPLADADLSAHSVFSTTIAPPPSEQETSQFSTTGMGMVAAQDTVDPVVEADTFLAFGRDAQAEEILLDALKVEPQPQAVPIRMKLLEIYSSRRDTAKFESVAREVQELTGGSGDVWEKAAAMGAAIDPDNSLYTGESAVAADSTAVIDLDATTVLKAGEVASFTPEQPAAAADALAAEASALDFDLDLGAASKEAPAPVPESSTLDFDLDLGSTPAEVPAPAATAPKADDVSLDIDFDMPAAPAPAASAAPTPAASDDSMGLDFPISSPVAEPAAQTPASVAAAPAADDGNAIDFNFDLGSATADAPAVVEPVPAGTSLSDISLDLPAPAASPEPPALDLGGLSLDLDAPAASPAAASDVPDNPEVATKLELAAAYEEMGDRDGAKELYQEAVAEGSPAQQDAARARLAALG